MVKDFSVFLYDIRRPTVGAAEPCPVRDDAGRHAKLACGRWHDALGRAAEKALRFVAVLPRRRSSRRDRPPCLGNGSRPRFLGVRSGPSDAPEGSGPASPGPTARGAKSPPQMLTPEARAGRRLFVAASLLNPLSLVRPDSKNATRRRRVLNDSKRANLRTYPCLEPERRQSNLLQRFQAAATIAGDLVVGVVRTKRSARPEFPGNRDVTGNFPPNPRFSPLGPEN